jgi:hypothetical protein
MSTNTFTRVLSYACLLVGLGLIIHALLPRGEVQSTANATPITTSTWQDTCSQQTVKLGTQAIETIQVGQRVISDDPTVQLDNVTSVDPATWRKLRLTAVWVWEDGTRDDWKVVTLQPLTWIEQHQLTVGGPAPIPLDLEEMGAPDDLRATVAAIEPCPIIVTGPGRVVLTTVNHLNPAIHELMFRDAQQQQSSVQTTRFHKFFKPESKTWHSTFELQPGDVVGGLHGDLTIVGNRQLPGVKRVYNLTVEGEHVYHVTKLGLLAHNMDCVPRIGTAKSGVKELPVDDLIHTHPVPREGKSIEETVQMIKSAGGYDVSHAIPVVKMPDGKLILAGGNHRLAAMKQLNEKTIPSTIYEWSNLSPRIKEVYKTKFPDVFGAY